MKTVLLVLRMLAYCSPRKAIHYLFDVGAKASGIHRATIRIALLAVLFNSACSRVSTSNKDTGPMYLSNPQLAPELRNYSGMIDLDLAQRTCALYVAVRSSAWNAPAFGLAVDDDMVHWNMCPGGALVACVQVPTALGDTLTTGIHWPY